MKRILFFLLSVFPVLTYSQDTLHDTTWEKAMNGDAICQTSIGDRYYIGKEQTGKNLRIAFEWYQKAANQDYPRAQYMLGWMFEHGEGVSLNNELAFNWYCRAADKDEPGALCQLGELYYRGKRGDVNHDLAFVFFKSAAELGNSHAQYMTAWMYQHGEGTKTSLTEAKNWYIKASEQGDIDATNQLNLIDNKSNYEDKINPDVLRRANNGSMADQYNLGLAYMTGNGVQKDGYEAIKWFKKASDQGKLEATFWIGNIYFLGKLVPQNFELAYNWFKLAAEKNYGDAQLFLGHMSKNGFYVSKDMASAEYWYLKAANQGHWIAQEELGKLYYSGNEIPRNYTEAFLWFQKASEKDMPYSHYMLGLMYENGQGVSKNLDKSKYWLKKAVALGNKEASSELKKLENITEPEPNVEIASIKWLSSSNIVKSSSYQIIAGINSSSKINSLLITVNGESYRGINPIHNDGFDMKVQKEVTLKEGTNSIRIDVANSAGVSSLSKEIIYQNPNPSIVDFSGKRIALVIGNSNYQGQALSNPMNDANDMSAKLKALGFNVITKCDVSMEELENAISLFATQANNYEVALFYYAGHGIQSSGENYMLPVNVNLTDESQLKYKCTNVNYVLDMLDKSKCKMKIIILDACRDNPFARSWHRGAGNRGLSIMNAPSGTLIAYATSPGSVASDGQGRNSPYTSALLKTLSRKGVRIYDFFQFVSESVREQTSNVQEPWFSSSLSSGNFYFNQPQ